MDIESGLGDAGAIICPNPGQNPVQEASRERIAGELAFGCGANDARLGIKDAKVRVVAVVVTASQNRHEKRVRIRTLCGLHPHLVGVVGLAVRVGKVGGNLDREDGLASGDELAAEHSRDSKGFWGFRSYTILGRFFIDFFRSGQD